MFPCRIRGRYESSNTFPWWKNICAYANCIDGRVVCWRESHADANFCLIKNGSNTISQTDLVNCRKPAHRIWLMSYLDKPVTETGRVALRYGGGFYRDSNNETDYLALFASACFQSSATATDTLHSSVWTTLKRLLCWHWKMMFTGQLAVMVGTEARVASNAKAKREFAWTLRYPSWRQAS